MFDDFIRIRFAPRRQELARVAPLLSSAPMRSLQMARLALCLTVCLLVSTCESAFLAFPAAPANALLARQRICRTAQTAGRGHRQTVFAGTYMGLGKFRKSWGGDGGDKKMLEVATDGEFEILLQRGADAGKLIVADFYASWCRQCFVLEPKYRKLAKELEAVATFVQVDALSVEYNKGKAGPNALKKKAGVVKYPTFQVWKDRKLVGEIVGGDMEMREFEEGLRSLVLAWKVRPAEALRVTGLGETAGDFGSQGPGDLGFGKWLGGQGGGQQGRSLGE